MDEKQFWTNVWRAGAIAAVSIVAVIAGCTAHSNTAIKDMVANGANPIDAMCSVNGTSTTQQCMVRAALGK